MRAKIINRDVTILLVEDDQIDRMAFERFIRQNELPYKYIIAKSVEEATDAIKKGGFDIAIVDFLLQDGTGLEVVQQIKNVPVIFATGQGDQKIAVEAMKAGVYDYLVKDSDRGYLDQLPVTIENAINHKLAKERLREMEREVEKLLWVVSKTENSMVIADKDGKIEWVNEGFERLTGFNQQEVVETYGDMLLRNNLSGLNPRSPHFKTLMTEKKSVSYESQNYTKDGKEIWVFTTITPILSIDGEIQKIIAIDSDISERKEVEFELIKAKHKAEKLARTKEEFLANMSHEIRTPMNAIIGMAELLRETKLDNKQQEYLKSIRFASENLLTLINDVLDLAKMEAGEMRFESVEFDIRQLLDSITGMLHFRVNEKRLSLECNIEDGVPTLVKGDPTRLNQILINLLSNAIKFTEQGQIGIGVKVLDKKEQTVKLQFDISDTGIGIPKSKHKSIFGSFTQGESETTRKYGGTGLGLSIVKKLIDLQGGTIKLESEVGKGSTFSIVIEMETANAAELNKVQDDKYTKNGQDLSGVSVLIVEDNELNQVLAIEFLNKAKAKSEVAKNGKEAVEMVKKGKFDIVLMDIQMPEMDGYQASRKLRSEGYEVPIIAMTAHAFQGEREKCLSAGMDDYLTKPIRFEKMVEIMAKALKSEKQ